MRSIHGIIRAVDESRRDGFGRTSRAVVRGLRSCRKRTPRVVDRERGLVGTGSSARAAPVLRARDPQPARTETRRTVKSDAQRDRMYVEGVLALDPERDADEILACRDRYRAGIGPEPEPLTRPDRNSAAAPDAVTTLAALHELRCVFRDRTPHQLDTALDAFGEAIRIPGPVAEWSSRLCEAAALRPVLDTLERDPDVPHAVMDHLHAWLTAPAPELDRCTEEAIEDLRSCDEAGSIRQAIEHIRTHHVDVARSAAAWLDQVDDRLSSARGPGRARGRRRPGGPEIPVVVWIYLIVALGLVVTAAYMLVTNWRFTVEIPS
jgi:hypothetical protein